MVIDDCFSLGICPRLPLIVVGMVCHLPYIFFDGFLTLYYKSSAFLAFYEIVSAIFQIFSEIFQPKSLYLILYFIAVDNNFSNLILDVHWMLMATILSSGDFCSEVYRFSISNCYWWCGYHIFALRLCRWDCSYGMAMVITLFSCWTRFAIHHIYP